MATKTIDAFAAITSIDNADEVLVWDVSAGTTRKITFANFQSGYLTTTTGLQASGATVGATSQAQAFTSGYRTGDGSSATPIWGFTNDVDTGIYRSGANKIAIALGGIGQFTYDYGSGIAPRQRIINTATSQ